MCLALLQRPESPMLSLPYFERAFNYNRHGCGFMYSTEDELVVRKAYWKPEEAHAAYVAERSTHPESFFAVHFRAASHGLVDYNNCHPHVVRPGWALIHNGMLPLEDQYPSQKSDTALFAEKLSAYSDYELVRLDQNDEIMALVGKYNSIVLMGVGNLLILNEEMGSWDNGMWRSNRNGGLT